MKIKLVLDIDTSVSSSRFEDNLREVLDDVRYRVETSARMLYKNGTLNTAVSVIKKAYGVKGEMVVHRIIGELVVKR